MINFASDNYSGVHPRIMQALTAANTGCACAYGDDTYTADADAAFKALFGDDIASYVMVNGTGANVLGLAALMRPYHAVVCSEIAHINVDETGAPENVLGSKLLTVDSKDGKLTPKDVEQFLFAKGVVHHSQPKVISITQSTEYGAVYTPEEVKALGDFAREHDMYLHMDGARIANAAAALGVDVASFTRDAGVHVLSFGGTKNGMMFGEAVVFFDKKLAEGFEYLRKQNLQLLSKMRYASCQFVELLRDDLWLQTARNSNAMAKRLAEGLAGIPGVEICNKVDVNSVFAIISPEHQEELHKQFAFYEWNEATHEVRLVCSFDTTEQEVDSFIAAAKAICR
ncbi:threonine aldolase family protein [Halodesulfovibrio marinisediminis]|uniref:L-threonine aldolase n=1 Tax=Halodesulfovibrio marinisediminis DSM 17456 TaxID=1121457 RepID=A0A1N6DTA0_9BACT|nr:aminotransferase class I/II-fold pyridoxal phosphate-dependent enzyme [Halodesulfovibrio marinisediminis]SIN74006.1 L-threonine aldolase [Halodesulfovibrio marinisediminis DSM 17456]